MWVEIDSETQVMEIPGSGTIVRSAGPFGACMVHIPGVYLLKGKLVKDTRTQPMLGGTRRQFVMEDDLDY